MRTPPHLYKTTYDDRFTCRGIDAEAVVYAASHHPDDILAAAYHVLLPFMMERHLAVCKEVAQFFAPPHAQGDEPVALATEAQAEGLRQFRGVQAGSLGRARGLEPVGQGDALLLQAGCGRRGRRLDVEQVAVLQRQVGLAVKKAPRRAVERLEDVPLLSAVETAWSKQLVEQGLRRGGACQLPYRDFKGSPCVGKYGCSCSASGA